MNKYLDNSNPKSYYSRVIDKKTRCGRRFGCKCDVKVAKWGDHKNDYTFNWNDKSLCKIKNGTLVKITVKKGYLGYSWILNKEFIEE